ncbi:hypothetical protein [Nocardioides sp.]|uniref:hypothetical protein n=1 Tax=Nocardioides sp. TaxID=35761 RepID=UPI0035140F8B
MVLRRRRRQLRLIPAALVVAGVLGLVSACGDDAPPIPQPPLTTPVDPAYDPAREPAAAALSLIPADSALVEVTDFDQARLAFGLNDVSSDSDARLRAKFWAKAERRSPLLSTGVFRSPDLPERRLKRVYGFTQDDVAWEARFGTDDDQLDGLVVRFRDDLDMAGVQRAVDDDVAGLAGAVVVPDAHVLALGATADPASSLAADTDLLAMVADPAIGTYLRLACEPIVSALPDSSGSVDLSGLSELDAYALGFGTKLVTAHLSGAPRDDVFARARITVGLTGADAAEYDRLYAKPVADPAGARIGWTSFDTRAALALARDGRIPFAACP